MNKLVIIVLAITTTVTLFACSGNNKTSSTDSTSPTEEVQAKETSINIEKINSISKEAGKNCNLSSSQIDFLYDQLEILIDKSEGMNSKEYRKFYTSLPPDEQEAYFTVGILLAEAEKKGLLSDSQKKRSAELEKRAPFGK